MVRLLAIAAAILAALFPRGPTKWEFEDAAVGGFPDNWTQMPTTKEGERPWKVVEDKTTPAGIKVLAHVPTAGEQTAPAFCFLDNIDQDFLGIEVWLRGKGGKDRGGAGLVWHLVDSKNYRIADWNPAKETLSVYAVKDGVRTLVKSTKVASAEGASDEWHRLRVHVWQSLSNVSVSLDGKELLHEGNDDEDADEEQLKPGHAATVARLGIWADQNADVLFDGFVLDGGEWGLKRRTPKAE